MTRRQRWALVLTSVASLMVALDVLVVSTALSTIKTHLHASVQQLEWTVNAYSLSFAVLLMTASALGDRFGRRRWFAGGLVLFVAASAACALSTSVGMLIAARALQGAGAAVVAPVSLALLTAEFPPDRRGQALGIFSGITGIAVLGGPVVGGAVTQGLAWQWIFWLNVPIGLLAVPFVLTRLRESYGPRQPLDVPGLVLVTAAALGIVWGLVRGNSAGWGSLEVIGTLATGVALGVAFVLWELRSHRPMLPMRLFRSPVFASSNAATFLMSAALFSSVFFAAQYQQVALGQSPLDAGLRLLPWTATLFFVAPVAGQMIGRIGARPLIVAGLLLQAIGMGWIALITRAGLPYAEMIVPFILAGAGVSMAIPAAQTAVVTSVGPGDIGKASGTFTSMRQLGGAFGVAVVVAVFSAAGSYATPAAFSDGVAAAMAVCAALSCAGAAVGVLAKGARATARGSQPVGDHDVLEAQTALAAPGAVVEGVA